MNTLLQIHFYPFKGYFIYCFGSDSLCVVTNLVFFNGSSHAHANQNLHTIYGSFRALLSSLAVEVNDFSSKIHIESHVAYPSEENTFLDWCLLPNYLLLINCNTMFFLFTSITPMIEYLYKAQPLFAEHLPGVLQLLSTEWWTLIYATDFVVYSIIIVPSI